MGFRSYNLLQLTAIIFLMLLLSPLAIAKDQGFDLTRFTPPTDNKGLYTMETSEIYRPYGFGLNLSFHFINDPFILGQIDKTGTRSYQDLIGSRLKMDLSFAVAFCAFYELGINAPFVLYQDGMLLKTGKAPSKFAFGDIRIHNKFVMLNREKWPLGLGLVVTVVVPSGDEQNSFGNSGVGAEFKLVLDGRIGPVLLVGNLGYSIRDELVLLHIYQLNGQVAFTEQIDDELLFGIGMQYFTPLKDLSVLAEIHGSTLAEDPFDQRTNTAIMLNTGIRYQLPHGLSLTAGVEVGLSAGFGVGPVGGSLALGWVFDRPDKDRDGRPDKIDKCPDEKEDFDNFEDEDGCPDPDNDADGINDEMDGCPNQAEDFDDYRDEDGCPDVDNDGDGILDADDKCPLTAATNGADASTGANNGCPNLDIDNDTIGPDADKCPMLKEDMDGFEDADGCPDLDNDQDQILDVDDKCPNQAEDKDGFEDEDGCPELDNDKDGVPDLTDKCPAKPETINGNKDDDGCPDKGKIVVIDKGKRLELKTPIKFKRGSARLSKRAKGLLNQVASVMASHGVYQKLIVESHTDTRGKARKQRKLTERRAKAVMDYLISQGINKDQIEAKGIGGKEPLAPNFSSWGRKVNNRIEFKILHAK